MYYITMGYDIDTCIIVSLSLFCEYHPGSFCAAEPARQWNEAGKEPQNAGDLCR